MCGGGGKEGWGGRCGLHKDKIIINNKEGRNKKGWGVVVKEGKGGGGGGERVAVRTLCRCIVEEHRWACETKS